HVICCFFFQAEDGIRDRTVTGVQTCALPISLQAAWASSQRVTWIGLSSRAGTRPYAAQKPWRKCRYQRYVDRSLCRSEWPRNKRSEERRVGKEWRCGVGTCR